MFYIHKRQCLHVSLNSYRALYAAYDVRSNFITMKYFPVTCREEYLFTINNKIYAVNLIFIINKRHGHISKLDFSFPRNKCRLITCFYNLFSLLFLFSLKISYLWVLRAILLDKVMLVNMFRITCVIYVIVE